MLKVRIRTLVPIRREPKKKNYLKPGQYAAEVNQGGTLCVHTHYGDYMPLPGQFEFIDAPPELLNYWRVTFLLVEAQAEYKRSNSYSAVTRLTSIQGAHEAAKRKLDRLFAEPEGGAG